VSRFPARNLRMTRTVRCVKLDKDLEGLPKPPFKGPLGQRLYDNVSAVAWRMWLEHSKMLINEFRLDLTSARGQEIWMTECEKYFFGEGSATPPDYVPRGERE
jgi:Fe-S cluster biosynthesis and repair protein YggX